MAAAILIALLAPVPSALAEPEAAAAAEKRAAAKEKAREHRGAARRPLGLKPYHLAPAPEPLDPVSDLPVRELRSITLCQRSTIVDARTVGTVPAADIVPYVHQRYDDLSVLSRRD